MKEKFKLKNSVSDTAEKRKNEKKFSKKWLYVSLVVHFSNKLSKKEILYQVK